MIQYICIIVYILILLLINIIRPSIFYSNENNLKVFGFKYDNNITPIPLYIFMTVFTVFLYLTIAIMSMFVKKYNINLFD